MRTADRTRIGRTPLARAAYMPAALAGSLALALTAAPAHAAEDVQSEQRMPRTVAQDRSTGLALAVTTAAGPAAAAPSGGTGHRRPSAAPASHAEG